MLYFLCFVNIRNVNNESTYFCVSIDIFESAAETSSMFLVEYFKK